VSGYHDSRFVFDERRETLWKTLCDGYFNRMIKATDTVLDLGAGYCHFINNVSAQHRIAIDQWEGVAKWASNGVRTIVGPINDLGSISDASVDFAFASNVFEHLSQADFAGTLKELLRTLKPGGTLTILQPNYKLAYREYFDDYTHISVYSETSLCDFLSTHEFEIMECVPGFLPFSIKSRWPVSPALIRLYLNSPLKPFAKQMLVRARPIVAALDRSR
jgi:ubiquinone/menaquinone biosynthesis C-methylase UbiE